jgi:hypothetical protein
VVHQILSAYNELANNKIEDDPMNQYNYNGKAVFMGIDVHKKTYVCVNICDGEIPSNFTKNSKPKIIDTNNYRWDQHYEHGRKH